MAFPVGYEFSGTIKLIVIIDNFHSVLFLAAAAHSLITELT